MYTSVILTQYGDPATAFEIREGELPELMDHQLTIDCDYSGLNYADVMARWGLYSPAPKLPCILGYEITGTVIRVGKSADKQWLGKRVLAFTRFGGYASHVNIDSHHALLLDDAVDGAAATALATQYATAYYAVYLKSHILPGDIVLQHAAAGGVGLAIFQMVKNLGGTTVGITGNEEKKKFLLSSGMNHVINRKTEDYVHYCREHFPEGVQWIYNSVAGSTFKKDLNLLSKGGNLLLYGAAERLQHPARNWGTLKFLWKMGVLIPIKLLIESKAIVGVNMLAIGDHRPAILRHCLEEVLGLYRSGVLHPRVKIFKYTQIAEAHEELETGQSMGKIAISWK